MAAGRGRYLETCASTRLIDRRDRALLLLGLAWAPRRSELAAQTVADLDFVAEGVKLAIGRSKADQEAAGQIVGVVVATGTPTCPVAALRTWQEAAGITEGAVFRAINRHGRIAACLSDRAIALIIKRRCSGGRHRSGELLGALAARRLRHRGSRTRGRGTRYWPAYPPSLDRGATRLYPRAGDLAPERQGGAIPRRNAFMLDPDQ